MLTHHELKSVAARAEHGGEIATRAGTLWATSACLLLFITAFIGLWTLSDRQSVETIRNIGFGSGVLAFSIAFATHFAPTWAVISAPVASIAGGVFCGGLTFAAEQRYPGIAGQAIIATSTVCGMLLVGYSAGLIQVTQRFRAITYVATASIAVIYLLSFLLLLLDTRLPIIHGAGWGGVLWSAFVVTIASMNLAVDFEKIDQVGKRKYPKYMEWYIGLGTIVTFVWLYISILRLLQRTRRL